MCSKDVQIITYWGQNSAYGADSREERDLVDICREDSPYDIVNIGFVNKFFDPMNTSRLTRNLGLKHQIFASFSVVYKPTSNTN